MTQSGTAQPVTTPTIRQAGRRARFWIIAAIAAVLIAVVTMVVTGASRPGGTPLSATNASPDGSMAIAEVLRQQGVTVTATDSVAATAAAVGSASNTTILVVDDSAYLDGDQLKSLGELSDHLVLMTPAFDQLLDAAPEIAQAGVVSGELTADCALAAVEKAGTVTGDGSGYRLIDLGTDDADADDPGSADGSADDSTGDSGAVSCLGSGDDIHSLIQLHRGEKLLTVVGTRAAFSNEHVAERGNAAFALNLLGASENLVWYLPTIEDAAVPGTPSIGDLTPAWVSAVMAMLLLVAIAAAFWRGRRLGPLVVENLPVTVRASETMEGRARLYQKSSARSRALDALRIGTVAKLGTLCGLSRRATVDEVILAAAAAIGRPPTELTALLRDESPASDTDLIRLSDGLLALERSTAEAIRPHDAQHASAPPQQQTGRIGQ